jgi:hypothetical protein
MGPEGGQAGGQVVAKGTPEQVAKNKEAIPANTLSRYLNSHEFCFNSFALQNSNHKDFKF